jgi:hypothetical protein
MAALMNQFSNWAISWWALAFVWQTRLWLAHQLIWVLLTKPFKTVANFTSTIIRRIDQHGINEMNGSLVIIFDAQLGYKKKLVYPTELCFFLKNVKNCSLSGIEKDQLFNLADLVCKNISSFYSLEWIDGCKGRSMKWIKVFLSQGTEEKSFLIEKVCCNFFDV